MAAIRIYGDPVLRKQAQTVTVFDDELKQFLEHMVEDMYENDGVGLAAPQVGQSLRIAVIDTTNGENRPLILVNPVIRWSSEQTEDDDEGCLSLPGIRLNVTRPASVSVDAFDGDGKPISIEQAEGLLARALQHEIDHLNGILFIDRAAPVYRRLIDGKLKKLARSGREHAASD